MFVQSRNVISMHYVMFQSACSSPLYVPDISLTQFTGMTLIHVLHVLLPRCFTMYCRSTCWLAGRPLRWALPLRPLPAGLAIKLPVPSVHNRLGPSTRAHTTTLLLTCGPNPANHLRLGEGLFLSHLFLCEFDMQ